MKRQLKMFLGIFTFCLCVMPFTGVNAEAKDYDEGVLTTLAQDGATLDLNAGDTVTISGTQYVGPKGYIDVKEGTVTFKNNKGRLEMIVNGTAESIHEKNLMFISGEKANTPIDLTVNKGATFNLNGNMALTTGTPVTFTNNGTVNIKGALEVRTGSTYTGNGTTNLYGKLAVYGADGSNLAAKVNVFEGANVYSESDIASNLVIGEQNTDKYTYTMGANDKSYTSISGAAVSNNFGYGYTLVKTEVTAPDTTVTDEPKNNNEEVTNPKTADPILLVALALLVSGGAAAFAGRRLAKQRM